ncbi:MAG: hypothetical protein HFE30_05865 [Clostridiales bacterium]|nr:hypothetical protein [Clostridiales bacterium]
MYNKNYTIFASVLTLPSNAKDSADSQNIDESQTRKDGQSVTADSYN